MFPVPEVPACVTHRWQDERERWWWHCLTCHAGSNRYGRHRGGHRLESDALCGQRQHARDKRTARITRAHYGLWLSEIHTTDDPERFRALWLWRWPGYQFRQDLTMFEVMQAVQSHGTSLSVAVMTLERGIDYGEEAEDQVHEDQVMPAIHA